MPYQMMRDEVVQKAGGKATAVAKVLTDLPAAAAARDDAANEFFLFHGLNAPLFLDSISKLGMDGKHSTVDGMFGAGSNR
jgi:hypothetical protein